MHPIHPWRRGIPTATEPWPGVVEARAGSGPMIEADDAIESAALEYLRDPARKNGPFALCVGFVAPHFPFVVPEPYFSMYYPDATDLPDMPPCHLENLPPAAQRLRQAFGFRGYSDDEVMRARAAYYGLITYLDDKISRLLDALQEHGLAEDTVVIHTSDHGECLGSRGLFGKFTLHDEAAAIPFIMAGPEVPVGKVVETPVSLVDCFPSVLEAVGATAVGSDLPGGSLWQIASAADGERTVFSEYHAVGARNAAYMLRNRKYKYILLLAQPREFKCRFIRATEDRNNGCFG